jgi:Tol biopolymer transport system component
MDADGRNAVQLTYLPNDVLRAAYLFDGRRILFSVFNAGKVGIWVMSADGGEPKPVVEPDVDLWAVSPNGDRLAFVSFDSNTNSKVTHIRPIGADGDEQVLNISPETWLEWGADGTSLYYNTLADNAANVWKTSLAQQDALPVTAFKDEEVYSFSWSPSGKTLACIRHHTTYDGLLLHFE